MLYLRNAGATNSERKVLVSCSGRREEGWRQCADGCVGHLDRYATGDDPHSANAVLYWLSEVAGAELVREWTSANHTCMSGEKCVRLIEHLTLFRSLQDVVTPVWVLLVDDHQYDERSYALTFTDLPKAQRAMRAEIDEAIDGCDC